MIRDQIRDSPEYQEIAATEAEQGNSSGSGVAAATTANRGQPRAQSLTIGEALGPVTQLEKGDVQFWTEVLQLVVLLLIYRELRGGT